VVLGLIVGKASGQGYFDYVREHICDPAGMKSTGHLEADVPVQGVASGYTRDWDGKDHPGEPRRNNIYTRPARGSSAGGGYSTADDLLKLVVALKAGVLGASDASRSVAESGVGIAGGAPGINAYVETLPKTGHVVVVLSNYDPPAAMNVGRRITGRVTRLD
jgi:CubicO group peptidase (beta-lactamase class C family)